MTVDCHPAKGRAGLPSPTEPPAGRTHRDWAEQHLDFAAEVPGGQLSVMGVNLSAAEQILKNAVESVGTSTESLTEGALSGWGSSPAVEERI
jgi:hypothetical protein